MNKDTARDYLPLVQALAEGRVIQWGNDSLGWTDFAEDEEFGLGLSPNTYRIKPEPVGPDEVWVVTYKGEHHDFFSEKKWAEKYAETGKGSIVRYIRADLAGEVS